MSSGHGKPNAGRDGSLPRAGAIEDRVNRTVGRLASLNRVEDRMQLVGRPDQLGRLPQLTSEMAIRRRELWIWLLVLAGGRPRGIGKLVDELDHPGHVDLRKSEHIQQCNVMKALVALQADTLPSLTPARVTMPLPTRPGPGQRPARCQAQHPCQPIAHGTRHRGSATLASTAGKPAGSVAASCAMAARWPVAAQRGCGADPLHERVDPAADLLDDLLGGHFG